jgi:hypothetical protein
MNIRNASLLFSVCLLASAAICKAANPDPFSEAPVATFEIKLKSFSAQPTEIALRDLNVLCRRLPVRDKFPGQIGAGHPQDRDVKLTCMFQFLRVLDQIITAPAPKFTEVPMEGEISDNPKQNPTVIAYWNLHQRMKLTRDEWARFYIPNFIQYDCRSVSNDHLRAVISRELASDSNEEDVRAKLLQQLGPS